MLIIGERINSSRKPVKEAIERKDAEFIRQEALSQKENGADFVDVNCGTFLDNEADIMKWLIETIAPLDIGLCIDSPNADTIKAGLEFCKKRPVIVNSITAEAHRANGILPLVKEHDAFVVALTMDESGMPVTAQDRVRNAEKILKFSQEHKVRAEKIYFDFVVQPVSSNQSQAKIMLEAIPLIKKLGDVKTICGLSNVSYGLPDRPLINAAFLAMCIAVGLDAAMIDPMDKKVSSVLSAALVLNGQDSYCMNYIRNFRKSKLKV